MRSPHLIRRTHRNGSHRRMTLKFAKSPDAGEGAASAAGEGRQNLHHAALRQFHRVVRAAPDRVAVDEERSEEHTSELQSRENLVCRLLLEKKKKDKYRTKYR